jgi:16S rRNA U516 pseudouridylate synthase RsuA-like enzyme
VQSLKRVRIMHIRLGDLPTGRWRDLPAAELRTLLNAAARRPAVKT